MPLSSLERSKGGIFLAAGPRGSLEEYIKDDAPFFRTESSLFRSEK